MLKCDKLLYIRLVTYCMCSFFKHTVMRDHHHRAMMSRVIPAGYGQNHPASWCHQCEIYILLMSLINTQQWRLLNPSGLRRITEQHLIRRRLILENI